MSNFAKKYQPMLHNFLAKQIVNQLPFDPNEEQRSCINQLAQFCTSLLPQKAFLLKGYAGTGKTSIVSALVKTFDLLQQSTILLAPTGRAAKVLANYANHSAFSIHKKIYRQKSISEFTFNLGYNQHKDTIFIVDEASMISNSGENSMFGSGRLLDDLIEYVYTGDNCSLILLGDTAQLPPIMQIHSPALEADKLKGYGLEVSEFTMREVVRQAIESGILYNATQLREQIEREDTSTNPKFNVAFPDIKHITGLDLIEAINSAYRKYDTTDTIIITRSNRRANLYNRGIRNQVLMKEDELSSGDLLMITKNNYYWSKQYPELDFIANGEVLEIVRIRKQYEMYGMRFADVILQFLDYDLEIDARILIDGLYTNTVEEQNALQQKLLESVAEDYADIGDKRKRFKEIAKNDFYNALHVKFAYAVTGHKAQGGQWSCVFVDSGGIAPDATTLDYLRWLYTSITRCKSELYLVNFDENYILLG